MAYYKQSYNVVMGTPNQTKPGVPRIDGSLAHYKTIILEKILQDSDPNDRHIKEWTDQNIKVKKLLNDMKREGLITIEFKNDRGCVRRILKQV